MDAPVRRSYSRKDLATIFATLPREDQKWSITHLLNIVLEEPKPAPQPKQKKLKVKRSDIEAVRKMMSFGEGCNVPADLDVREVLAEKYL